MPDIEWNQRKWEQHNWNHEGERWSKPWGSSEAQWFATLYPRLHSFLPAKNILEIAPGRGRWTRFLLPQAQESYRAVDIVHGNIHACNTKFKNSHKDFLAIANDGKNLSAVCDRKYDFIFSFDSLVHVNEDVLSCYIKQVVSSLLTRDGVCFFHHSNMKYSLNEYGVPPKDYARDPDIDVHIVEKIITENGGKILLQEIISWGDARKKSKWPVVPCCDALVLFATKESERIPANPSLLVNTKFLTQEVQYIRRILSECSIG